MKRKLLVRILLILGLTQKNAYFLLSRVRKAWKTSGCMLSGSVEVDKSYFGGKEKNKHKNKKLNAERGTVGKTLNVELLIIGYKA